MENLRGHERKCVKLRGLPWSSSPDDVIVFFGDLKDDIASKGVHMVLNANVRNVVSSEADLFLYEPLFDP